MSGIQAALYLHYPFCKVKCDYCDFYSVCDLSLQGGYFHSLARQIAALKSEYQIDSFETLYFGGGTPGMADHFLLASLFEDIALLEAGTLPEEVTLECNPRNVSRESLEAWRGMGITRLSLGVQSFRDEYLERAGRRSSRTDILSALDRIREDGRFNLNVDLIQGLPGMGGKAQLAELNEALSFEPDHISWYGLILEEGTLLAEEWEARRTGAEDEDESAWEEGCRLLEERGYRRYEISNFCRPGRESRHNSMYWRMRPYLGCGPAAVSMLPDADGRPVRFRTKEDLPAFASGDRSYTEKEVLSPVDFLKDFLLMGLRLAEGIDTARFKSIFGIHAESLFPRSLERWCAAELLVLDEAGLRASAAGMDLLNTILVSLFAELEDKDLSGLSCRFLS
jgi:oxygen-independent coproporphyrinogen-3 oxidase